MTAAEARVSPPPTLDVIPDNIPDDLKSVHQFLCWGWEYRDGKWTKPPLNAHREGYAKSTDPKTWASFEVAFDAYRRRKLAGIGLALSASDLFFFIDLDHCRDRETDEIDFWAIAILETFKHTYQEVSPSGTGMRIIGRGRLPKGPHTKRIESARPGAKIELFDSGKYTTLTGHRHGFATSTVDCQKALDVFHADLFPPAEPHKAAFHSTSQGGDDDEQRLEQARKSPLFVSLFDRGDTSGHGNDHSAADQALCNLLAFWFGPDRSRIDRNFRRSGLMREKWDKKHHGDGRTYGQGTIDKALEGRTEFYSQRGRGVWRVVEGGRSEPPPPDDEPSPNPPHAEDPEIEQSTPREAIDAGNQDLEFISAQAWRALRRWNTPPRLFRFGGVPVRIEGNEDDAVPVAQTLTEDRLSHELARSAEWFKVNQKGDQKAASPPPRVIKDMLASPSYPLPALVSIVQTPVFAPDGSLQLDPGYHEAARSYYAPAPGFTVPAVSDAPSDDELDQAKSLIVDDLLGEFSFISQAKLANTVALFLDPYVRNLIDGPTPLRLIEAPTPGSGKGLLADVILRAAIGRRINIMPAANDDDEWRKRVTAQLSQLPAAILIDNLTSALDSGALASALTTTWWNDRRLGAHEMIRVPIRCVWLATANNPTMSTELARRTVRIRLDPKVDRPWQHTGFRHEDLRGWADEHRPQLVWTALTLIRSWIVNGQPMGNMRLGSFERWAAVQGGILANAGISGFLSNLEEFYEASDLEGAIWRQFVDLWFDKFNEREVGVADLFGLAQNVEGFDFGKGSERSQRTSFGMALNQQRDRVIGDCRLVQIRTVRRLKQWRLIKSRPGGNPFDAFRPDSEPGDDQWTR